MEEKSFITSFDELLKFFDRFQSAIFLHVPRLDLSKIPDERLLVGMVYLRWLRLEYVTKTLDSTFPGLSWVEAYKRALSLVDSFLPAECACLYATDRNLNSLARFLRQAALELVIFEEIEGRAKKNELGKELYVHISSDIIDPLAVLKALKFDKISSYRPEKESGEDLKQLALEKAWHYYSEMGKMRMGRMGRLLEQAEKTNRWDALLPRLQAEELRTLLRHVWPTLPAQAEKLYEQVQQALRDHFEKWKAQKRTGKDVPLEEADKTILRRSGSGTWTKKGERVEDEERPDTSERMFEILKEAKKHKRWGDKAVKAFKDYLDGKTEAEAARLAGITDRTFRNYITKLQKLFAAKK